MKNGIRYLISCTALGLIFGCISVAFDVNYGELHREVKRAPTLARPWAPSALVMYARNSPSEQREIVLVPQRVPADAPRNPEVELRENRMPASEPTPIVAPPEAPGAGFQPYFSLTLTPELYFSRINSTDKSTGGAATYNSNIDPGLSLLWKQKWSARFETSVDLGVRTASYSAPSALSTDVAKTRALTNLGAGLRVAPLDQTPGLLVDTSVGFNQQLFARATSLTSITLDSIMIPQIELGPRYELLSGESLAMTLHASAIFYFASESPNYSINPGYGYSGGMELTHKVSNKSSSLETFGLPIARKTLR